MRALDRSGEPERALTEGESYVACNEKKKPVPSRARQAHAHAHAKRDRSDRALAEWESHLACNEKPVTWNLRNPTKAAIASALHVLAGILPIHVGCPAPAPRAALLRST